MKTKWRMYQQVDRKVRSCAGTETCAPSPVSGFHLGGTDRTSAERRSRRARGPINATERCGKRGLRKQQRSLTQTVSECGEGRASVGTEEEKRFCGVAEEEPADLHIFHVQAPHVNHVPTFNNKPQHVSHGRAGFAKRVHLECVLCV